jgi:hypothetical protein
MRGMLVELCMILKPPPCSSQFPEYQDPPILLLTSLVKRQQFNTDREMYEHLFG